MVLVDVADSRVISTNTQAARRKRGLHRRFVEDEADRDEFYEVEGAGGRAALRRFVTNADEFENDAR